MSPGYAEPVLLEDVDRPGVWREVWLGEPYPLNP
jgi:hypothetical protein